MAQSDVSKVREWVGSSIESAAIAAALSEHDGDTDRAALAILRARRADMVMEAAKFAVAGDYSQDATANIKALTDQIERLERALDLDEAGLPEMTAASITGPTLGR